MLFEVIYPFGSWGPHEVTVTLPEATSHSLTMMFRVRHDRNDTDGLFAIIAHVYNFNSSVKDFQAGEGRLIEPVTGRAWHLSHLWPTSVNFGYLDYSSDPNFDMEITWRFAEMTLICFGFDV